MPISIELLQLLDSELFSCTFIGLAWELQPNWKECRLLLQPATRNKKGRRITMKRCALVISDDPKLREWIGGHISTWWPKMLIENTRLANAPMYLDRAPMERYRLIVVRMSFQSHAAMLTSIFLMRILRLESHPEIVVITESPDELQSVKTTELGNAHCLLASNLTSAGMQKVLEDLAGRDGQNGDKPDDGAPNLPGYIIRRPITGTFTATLYRAFSEKLGCDVALKICDMKSDDKNTYRRSTLRQEYEVLRKLGGQFVAKAYEYGEIGDLGYMAMEYFPRGSIDRVIAESDEGVSRLQYMLGVAKALREIHKAGFLHLDIKPNNVLIREDGTPVLIDFGISERIVAARYSEGQHLVMASPYFMSPEQARGETLDERSDLFSFGALWYRVFTGRVHFHDRTFINFQTDQNDGATPKLGPALQQYQPIIDGTLAFSAADRFPNADVLIQKIESYIGVATGVRKIGRQFLGHRSGDSIAHNTVANQTIAQRQVIGAA
jgi:hypothetical protein